MNDPLPTTIQPGLADDAPLPRGFRFGAGRCGIKQARLDVGVIVCDQPVVAAGTFTRNRMRAACVERSATLVPAESVRAVLVNSGNANAMTGEEGEHQNLAVAASLASALACAPEAVLTASTGIIGVPLPGDLIAQAIPGIAAGLDENPRHFAQAILTTDTTTKLATALVEVPGGNIRLLGVAKGSGMVHPDMATTLGFVCTDAAVAPAMLDRWAKAAIADTFGAITVDGDSSTNDMALVLASGASGIDVEQGEVGEAFATALRGVLWELARQVANDGEGATRLLEVEVTGAPDRDVAQRIARGIARSSLVKCSVFAGQPEWGRVAMAAGQAAAELGLELSPSDVTIAADGIVMFDPSGPRPGVKSADLKRRLRRPEVKWSIDLGLGEASFVALGCDLSYDYVRINADEAKQIEVSRSGGVARRLSLAAYSPRLKQQLLVEGLAYVRRFVGLRALVYLQPACGTPEIATSLARDLELCLDAGLRTLAVLPDDTAAQTVGDHMRRAGHFAATVPPDPMTISNYLDRGHLCLLVREAPNPDTLVDLALKLGIQKVLALGADQGLRDSHGFVQRLSPDTLLAGIERGRFDASDPDLLVLARHAATRGIPALHIIDARLPHAVVGELFTDEGIGTLVTRQALA